MREHLRYLRKTIKADLGNHYDLLFLVIADSMYYLPLEETNSQQLPLMPSPYGKQPTAAEREETGWQKFFAGDPLDPSFPDRVNVTLVDEDAGITCGFSCQITQTAPATSRIGGVYALQLAPTQNPLGIMLDGVLGYTGAETIRIPQAEILGRVTAILEASSRETTLMERLEDLHIAKGDIPIISERPAATAELAQVRRTLFPAFMGSEYIQYMRRGIQRSLQALIS